MKKVLAFVLTICAGASLGVAVSQGLKDNELFAVLSCLLGVAFLAGAYMSGEATEKSGI